MVYAVKAKYHVLVDKDFEKASVLYDKAIQFATLLEDEVLIKNLTKEKEDDIPKWHWCHSGISFFYLYSNQSEKIFYQYNKVSEEIFFR